MKTYVRIVRLVLSVVIASHLGFGQTAQVLIPEGTKIHVQLEQELSGETAQEGQPVQLSVLADVKVGDMVVIAKGASVSGRVTLAQPKRRLGRTGKIDFSAELVTAVDNAEVPLRYTVNRKEGGSTAVSTGLITTGVAIVFFPAAPFMLLRRGKEARIERGTIFEVFTDQTHTLSGAANGATATVSPDAAQHAQIDIMSDPDGADVEINGDFVGSTPITMELEAGSHEIIVKKNGFQAWRRLLKTGSANVRVIADLEPEK